MLTEVTIYVDIVIITAKIINRDVTWTAEAYNNIFDFDFDFDLTSLTSLGVVVFA